MTFDQGHFNFDARNSEAGYLRWREELDALKRAFESRHGVILGRRVRVELRDYLRPIEGIIHLVEEKKGAKDRQPHLKIGKLEFTPSEIVNVVALGDAPSEPSD